MGSPWTGRGAQRWAVAYWYVCTGSLRGNYTPSIFDTVTAALSGTVNAMVCSRSCLSWYFDSDIFRCLYSTKKSKPYCYICSCATRRPSDYVSNADPYQLQTG